MRITLLLTVIAATALALPATTGPLAKAEDKAALAARDALLADLAARSVHPHPENPKPEMEEKKAASGKTYRVVRPAGSRATEIEMVKRGESLKAEQRAAPSNATETRENMGDFWTKLNPIWRLNRGGYTTDAFRRLTAIDSWALDYGGVFYKQRVNFWDWEFQITYGFLDESGDWYWCDVVHMGHHYIDYDSDKPNIIAFQGV